MLKVKPYPLQNSKKRKSGGFCSRISKSRLNFSSKSTRHHRHFSYGLKFNLILYSRNVPLCCISFLPCNVYTSCFYVQFYNASDPNKSTTDEKDKPLVLSHSSLQIPDTLDQNRANGATNVGLASPRYHGNLNRPSDDRCVFMPFPLILFSLIWRIKSFIHSNCFFFSSSSSGIVL